MIMRNVTIGKNNNNILLNTANKILLSGGYQIGEFAYCGIIGYIFKEGDIGYDPNTQHGIVVSINTFSGLSWGCQGIQTYASGGTVGTGNINTSQIISICTGLTIAARVCSDLVEGGCSDWFLPSYYELENLHYNMSGGTWAHTGGTLYFIEGSHWTSTEGGYDEPDTGVGIPTTQAWFKYFSKESYGLSWAGAQFKNSTTAGGAGPLYVRPIRYF